MLTEYEARKLQQDMEQELSATPGVVYRCAVLLVLLMIGLAWSDLGDKESAGRSSPSTATPGISHAAEPHSKTVFGERRQRHIDRYPDSIVAREAANRGQTDVLSDEEHFALQTK